MRLAILGGSFNPIHLGHLFLADAVLSHLRYDRVVMVPAFRSPFKLAATGMEDSARDRLEMIAASIAGDPRLTVDGCEIHREGVSYTVDTIEDIIRRYNPEGKPGLIIGDDLADEFPRWHRSEEILEMADIIIARRIHSGAVNVSYPNIQIANDVIEIASGQVRERIAADSAWRYLVPAAARSIIEERGLYGLETPAPRSVECTADLIVRVEDTVRSSLSLERFLHSRNTALMAWDMCRRFGPANRIAPAHSADSCFDPQLGYLAGIAHDLGKTLSDKEQIRLAKSDGMGISRLEKEKPSLLHGRSSAVLLRERFDVRSEAVLEAVALHTMGGRNMSPLAKIVYIADKTEVSREKADPVVRKLAQTGNNLDMIFYTVLNHTVSWLRARKLSLSDETLGLLEKMKRFSL